MRHAATWAVWIAIGASVGATWEARAQDPSDSHDDRRFARMAASGGEMVVVSGRLARTRALDPDVRRLADRMVRDHNRSWLALIDAARGEPPGLSVYMTREHQGVLNRLGRLKGGAFDRAFIQEQVEAHRKSVALYEAEVQHGRDAALRAFAARTLPTLREHLRLAEELAAKPFGDESD